MTVETVPLRRTLAPEIHRDLARAISAIENGYGESSEVFARFSSSHPAVRTDAAYVMGITGPPGAGKSTVIDGLLAQFRLHGDTVATLAIDPSSPFTHGAVLGDRVRMQRHSGDGGVFVRSMASREAGGGLAPATREALALVQRAGFDIAIVETVGVGQVELEIVSVADVIVVVTVPGLGDGVQSIKAGLTEIADLFVVNMADRPGANATALELKAMVRESARDVPVLQTVATSGTGIAALADALYAARESRSSNAARAVRFDVLRYVRDEAVRRAAALLERPEARAVFARLTAHELTRTESRERLLSLVAAAERERDAD